MSRLDGDVAEIQRFAVDSLFSAVSSVIGLAVGLVCGYFKRIDAVVMRVMDGIMAIPSILLAIALITLTRPGLGIVIVAIVIPEVPRVELNPQECQKDFEAIRSRELEFVELFAQHPSFSISYEEMVARDAEKIRALLDFMGVSPRELTTTTRRLGCDDLRQVIVNFEELRTYFAGSPYSKFFEQA